MCSRWLAPPLGWIARAQRWICTDAACLAHGDRPRQGKLAAEGGGASLARRGGLLEVRPRFPRPFRGMNKRPPVAAS